MVSARVLNVVRSEFCKMSASPAVNRNLPCGRQLENIKRDLFGTAKTNLDEGGNGIGHLSAELERHQEQATQKWGFDFRAGNPLGSNSPYIWERVSFQESSFAPAVYTLTRAAHVRPTPAEATDMDTLLNERAARENGNLSSTSLESHTDNESCYDSQDETLLTRFNQPSCSKSCPSSSTSAPTLSCTLRKRQPKITEFMKERKRLAQAPKKLTPNKRMRTSSGSSSNSAAGVSNNSYFSGLLKRSRPY